MPEKLHFKRSSALSSFSGMKQDVLWVLVGLFCLVGGEVLGQDPNYTYDAANSKNLDYFTVTIADAANVQAKLNRLIIAVDTNPNGEQFVLTFGNGIKRVGANGGLVNFIPNQNDLLSNSLDFAINSDGKFFVATNESGRRYIRVYSPTGVYLPNENLGDGTYGYEPNKFKGPTGLTFDKDDNLYVADHYIGNENPPKPSAIKIYRKDASGIYKNNLITHFDNVSGTLLNFPYRLAVNSQRQLYVSELGPDNKAKVIILQLDSNFVPTKIGEITGASSQIGAPGSIVIDKFDNVFIADFGDEIDLPRLLRATGDPEEFANVFEIIKKGIQNNTFKINIYNSNNSLRSIISSGIDFPIDLAISKCGTLYVNNSIFAGKFNPPICIFGLCSPPIPDISLDFDLEVYQRSAGYDTEDPVLAACPEDIIRDVDAGKNYATVNFPTPGATDNCSFTVIQTKGPSSGYQFMAGTTTEIQFTATDASGNIDTCTFTITVNPAEEPDPVTINCLGNKTGNFGSDCRFEIPDYTGNATYTTGATITQNPAKGIFVNASQKIVLTATLNGQTETCEFELILSDKSSPVITFCPGSRTVTADASGKFIIPDYTNEIIATDNCSSTVNIAQNPSVGEVIDKTTEILFTATDAAGNPASCSFTLTLSQQSATFADCSEDIIRSNEPGKCGAVVTYSKPTASDSNGNVEVTLKNGPASGSYFQVGSSTLVFEATGSNGVTVECSFDVVVEDKEKPKFNDPCEGVDYTANFEVEEGFTVPNFFQQFGGTDNCDSEVSFVQEPAPGTMVYEEGSFPVTLTIQDDFGNFNTCSFTVTLTSSNSIDLSCNSQFLLEPDENCEFRLPDLSGEYIYAPSNAVLTQSIPQGEILTEDTEVIITATYGGESINCNIKVILVDYIDPILSCLPNQNVPFTPAQGFTLPNYISQLTYSDNCEVVSVTQEPLPGTVIRSNQIVKITVTDNFENTSYCIFDIYLQEEGNPVEIFCAEDQTRNRDENCGYLIPNLTSFATATEGATITQSPTEGTFISETQTIRLTATLDGVTDFCEFELILVDNTLPQLNCPPDQVENYDPAIGFTVPDYTGMAGASDNCGVVEVVQTPAEGTPVFGTTEIKLTAKDQAGNVAECTFNLTLTEEEVLEITCIPDQVETLDGSCQFVIPNYTDQASVNYPNATITQSPEPGLVVTSDTNIVLTASLNGETDICEFKILLEEDIEAPVANCILTGIFELGPNGTLTLPAEQIENNSTDNCGIAGFAIDKSEFTTADIGENVITLTVTDTAGNEGTCQTTITIVPNENTGSDFTCVSQTTLELDSTGNATLNVEDLYTGDPGNRTFTLSRENFNCTNTGANIVTLTYTGSDGSGTCEINVEVVDKIAPVLIVKDISVGLNAQGQATISPQMINNGSYDNCGELTLSLNKTIFSCKDIGERVITLTGEDASGNTSTATATVTITGNCNGFPEDPVDHIYIYPNPTPGPFTFAVPQGWIIEKAEVFDSRGRHLSTKVFEPGSPYSMDLTGLQDAVYVLSLFTSQGKKIVRVIIH